MRLVIHLTCLAGLLLAGLLTAVKSQDDAEFWRRRNYQAFELERTMDIDVTKTRNYQAHELHRTMGIDLSKTRNYQSFELIRTMNVDVSRLRNYLAFDLSRTMNVDVTRSRNYQAFTMLNPFELGPAADVRSMRVTDQNGNTKDTFSRGNTVQFEFIVENTGNTTLVNGLISVQILDPTETPIFLNYFYETLTPGTHRSYVVGYRIPDYGSTGTHTAKVMLFTNWPSQGGSGLDSETSSFNVTT